MIEKCAVVARSEEEALELLRFLDGVGMTWASETRLPSLTNFCPDDGGTTYYINDFSEGRVTYLELVDGFAKYQSVAEFLAVYECQPVSLDTGDVL